MIQPEHPLKSHILWYVNLNTSASVDEETRNKMAESLCQFILDAVEKFDKGQREHGGKLEDRDLVKEVGKEILDTFWYTQAMLWKARGK